MHYEKDGLGQYLVPDASDAITNCGYIMALRHGFVMPYEKEFRIHYPNYSRDFHSTATLYATIRQHLLDDIEHGCNFGELADALNPTSFLASRSCGAMFNLQDVISCEIAVISKQLSIPATVDRDILSKILFCIEGISDIMSGLQKETTSDKLPALNSIKAQLERFKKNLEVGAQAYKAYEQFNMTFTSYVDFGAYLEVLDVLLERANSQINQLNPADSQHTNMFKD